MSFPVSVGAFVYLKRSSTDLPLARLIANGGTVSSINDRGVATVVTPNRALSVKVHVSHLCPPTHPDAQEPFID